jgi:lipoyl(octanoyl) transferase
VLTTVLAGRTRYAEAVAMQREHHEAVLAGRAGGPGGAGGRGGREGAGAVEVGRIILTEHEPVVTATRRGTAAGHVLFSRDALAARGVELCETDRGGDVTYHGPGQLVCYPIVDLNRLGLNLHGYMRALEEAVIGTLARFGIAGERDPGATGVWVRDPTTGETAKICAMGVRIRRWVTMHGLAVNVDPEMGHFDLVVPCGLAGRGVTSMRRVLEGGGNDNACPELARVGGVLIEELNAVLLAGGRQADGE